MTPLRVLTLIDGGLDFLRFVAPTFPAASPEERVELLAISGQEGDFRYRRQIGGPARSLWQFEHGGGVVGVLGHATAGPFAHAVCAGLDIPSDSATVFEAMAWSDPLAVAMARLLLLTGQGRLPGVGQEQAGWDYYEGLWRPGDPGPDRWPGNYAASMEACGHG